MQMSVNDDFKLPLIIPSKPIDTVRVASDETESGYVIINAHEFDASKHTAYIEPAIEPAVEKTAASGKSAK